MDGFNSFHVGLLFESLCPDLRSASKLVPILKKNYIQKHSLFNSYYLIVFMLEPFH